MRTGIDKKKYSGRRRFAFWLAVMLAVAALAGCSGNTASDNALQAAGTDGSAADGSAGSSGSGSGVNDAVRSEDLVITEQLGEGGEMTVTYFAEDFDSSWDADTAVSIVFDGEQASVSNAGSGTGGVQIDGTTVTIRSAGTYVASGQSSDGNIVIDVEDDDTVRLVLNGLELTSQTTAPIYSKEKNKLIVTLADGTMNVLADSGAYQYEKEGDDEPDSPLYADGDLTINGSGVLTISGNYIEGIHSKGTLRVMSGDITITSAEHGLKGKDAVLIYDGILTIHSGKDGIKANNDSDAALGYIWIDGGTIAIAAQDDGIQAETALVIRGGEITITESDESLAAKMIDILGGLIDAVAQDDGINSAAAAETEMEKMMDQEGVYTRIAGGEVRLNASADGIDSNGDFYMEGGALYLSGPVMDGEGIFDYNGSAALTGGTVFAAGSAGMMQTFGADSTQNYIVIYYEETQAAGTRICLTDADGTELGSYEPDKEYRAALISVPGLESGNVYHVITGENDEEVTIGDVQTVIGEGGFGFGGMDGGMGGPGMGGRGMGGGRKFSEDGEMPEDFQMPEGGEMPEGFQPGEGGEMPEGMQPPENGEMPEGMPGGRGGMGGRGGGMGQ